MGGSSGLRSRKHCSVREGLFIKYNMSGCIYTTMLVHTLIALMGNRISKENAWLRAKLQFVGVV